MTLFPLVVEQLKAQERGHRLFRRTIPPEDCQTLKELGVREIFTAGRAAANDRDFVTRECGKRKTPAA